MHEMQTIDTDVRGVYVSVCPSISLSVSQGDLVQPLPVGLLFGVF